MRIHIQNPPDDPLFDITWDQWRQAAARAPDIGAGHAVSLGATDADFAAAIGEADALVTAANEVRDRFPLAAPLHAPKLRLIFCTSAGLDRIAPFDRLPPGAALLNNRGTHGAKAGEFVLMALMMLANRLPAMIVNQRNERFAKIHAPVLRGRSVTIVGLGAIGGAAAANAAQFGMRVTGVRTQAAPHPNCARVVATNDLDRVLPDTEFLVLACPLTPATRGLLDRRRLALLPAGAGLINVGRGAVLDQDAVCDALDAGYLSGAVLDVFVPEPVPPGHRLWTTQNLVMTPHVSADDPLTYNASSLDIFFENLRADRDGRALPNLFDVARGY